MSERRRVSAPFCFTTTATRRSRRTRSCSCPRSRARRPLDYELASKTTSSYAVKTSASLRTLRRGCRLCLVSSGSVRIRRRRAMPGVPSRRPQDTNGTNATKTAGCHRSIIIVLVVVAIRRIRSIRQIRFQGDVELCGAGSVPPRPPRRGLRAYLHAGRKTRGRDDGKTRLNAQAHVSRR
jgi:hypothetical protein